MKNLKYSKSVVDSRPEARRWIEATLKQLNYKTTGELSVVVEEYLGDVWSIDTDRGKVYFKATAALPLFANEAEIAYELKQLFQNNVADVIAINKDRCWQLMKDFGDTVGHKEDADVSTFSDIYHLWGGLQRQSVDHLDKLAPIVCEYRGIDKLVELLYHYLEQPDIALAVQAQGVVINPGLREKLDEVVQKLKSYSLPECLVHGDLHDNNVAKTAQSYLFFDWSDACISHPFMEGHIMYRLPDSDKKQLLIQRYLSNWTDYLPC